MGRKRRGKSVRNNTKVLTEPDELVNAPHSFVIHKGLTGGFVQELTKDFRKVMEPFTASALKERKNNTIKDFVHVAGILHVTHLTIFSRTENGIYMKIGKIPRGPTLSFKVHEFSLARDVVSSLKKQLVVDAAFKHSPLIVLNNFSGEGMQFKLMASMLQNMFPTLNLQTVDLNTVRRVVMLNYVTETKMIDFRHYTIKVQPVGISKGVKKVVAGKIPNLARCTDISEFLTKSGLLSESEAEDDPNAHVTLSQKMASRGNIEHGKSSIRLSELGPRMTLQLIKIEDGLMDGEVLFHELIEKTEEEKEAIRKSREAKRKLKEKRRKIQDENTKRKEQAKEALKQKSLAGMKKTEGDEEQEGNVPTENTNEDKTRKRRHGDDGEWQEEEEDDDAQYYRDEVGEEPDKDLFSARSSGFQRPKTFHSYKKRPRNDGQGKFGDNKHGGGSFAGGSKGGKFKKDKFDKGKGGKFGNKGGKGTGNKNAEKTNASKRDFRPIGVKSGKTGVRKFSGKKH